MPNIRRGRAEDAPICADILNRWIDETSWMPRVHDAEDVRRHYREFVFKTRKVWVAEDPVAGYLCFDPECDEITSLYASPTGAGTGKALLDHLKRRQDSLSLWTFVANQRARAFYRREGFREVDQTEGDNEEGLPDVLLTWEAA